MTVNKIRAKRMAGARTPLPRSRVRSRHGGPATLLVRAQDDHQGDDVLDLVPGVRDRLQLRLATMGVPADKAVSHVARITHRAAQSVRRWFDPGSPGLPDLQSFARLCAGLDCSADEMIGIPGRDVQTPASGADLVVVANCIHSMAERLTRSGNLGVPMRVPGDEMAPHLREGDLVFVDTTVDKLSGNGLYALRCDGQMIIRRVEQRIDKGLVLKCDNKAYGDHAFRSPTTARHRGLEIIGKIHGSISARAF